MPLKVWYNGKIVEDATVPITCHTLHYGTGVFEGIRCYKLENGKNGVFRLKDHIKRLLYSASVLKMKIPFSEEELINACKEVVIANNLEDAYIRPIAFYNFGKIGLNVMKQNVDVTVFAIHFPKYLGAESIKVKISSYGRISPLITEPRAKITGHYLNSVLATMEAKAMGYDEALLLDMDGNVAEGPGENIFFVKDNILVTPSSGSILEGITRDSVMKFASDLGLKVEVRNVSVHELECFDEAFFTGTAAEITPIRQINDITYSIDVSKKVQKYYLDIVRGKVKKYLDWIDVIEHA
jgi:branched-chain amino acid aminotransferase